MYRVFAFLDREASAPVTFAIAALVCVTIGILCATIGGLHIEVRP